MPLTGTNLTYAYPKGPKILHSIDCTIDPGSITVIIGPNGAGKSTLLRVLAGVSNPESGEVRIHDHAGTQPISRTIATRRAARIAYIAQRSSLAFDFDVRQVVSFGRLALPKDPQAIDRAIDRFELTSLASSPMGTLSVGQQQRVSLARAWAQLDANPSAYLLADEPTSAMDPKQELEALAAFRELADRGVGVAIIAHDLPLAARCADHAILLTLQGTIHAQGPAETTLTPQALQEVFETPFLAADVQGQRVIVPQTVAAPS